MQGAVGQQQDGECDENGQYQAGADNHTSAETVAEHQHDNHNEHGFQKVDEETVDGVRHLIGLEEYLIGFKTYRHPVHNFSQFLVDQLAHIRHNGIAVQCDADAEGWFAVDKKSSGLRFLVGALHFGNVADANLLAGGGADVHVGNVLLVLQLVVHTQLQTVVAIFIVSGIHGLACILESQHDLSGDDARAG